MRTILILLVMISSSVLGFDSVSGVDFKDNQFCNELVDMFYDGTGTTEDYELFLKECSIDNK